MKANTERAVGRKDAALPLNGEEPSSLPSPEPFKNLFVSPTAKRSNDMGMNSQKSGTPGTTDQSPRWEGPQETRPSGYLPAKDNPDIDRDAVGENNQDPNRDSASDVAKTKGQ